MQTLIQPPYRNFRQLLSMHAKTARDHEFLIQVLEDGTLERLVYIEFNARVHQTANLLYDDLHVKRGNSIALCLSSPVDLLFITFGAWIVGASVVFIPPNLDLETIKHQLRISDIKAGFFDASLSASLRNMNSVFHVIRVGDDQLASDLPDYRELVKNLPTTFLGNESHAKSDDDSVVGGEETPVLHDPALILYSGDDKPQILTQRDLLSNAWSSAFVQGITASQKILCTSLLSDLNGLMTVLTALYVGGSVILFSALSPSFFWHLIVSEQVHVAACSFKMLEMLHAHAEAQFKRGQSIFADRISRRELTHFRHLVCVLNPEERGRFFNLEVLRRFESMFGMTVLTGMHLSSYAGTVTLLPIDLSWDEHQSLINHGDAGCIGVALPVYDLDIAAGDVGDAGSGEIRVRWCGDVEWHGTGMNGYQISDALGRRVFYVQRNR